jgi:hypothetical protein|uniref:Uncharacterized protein n=1 Tax=viral metagenome TaxID=1070528 RepID=A0A6C0E1U5_9ZZZZ
MSFILKVVLTRYLYDLEGVVRSLHQAMVERDYEKAIFWAYEMYYSGFRKEVLNILWRRYAEKFSANHPKLGFYIRSKIDIDQPACISTVLKNLTMKNPGVPEPANVRFVNVKEYHIEKYRTREPAGDTKPWKYLAAVCKYAISPRKEEDNAKERLTTFRERWLYHASFSSIWRERILAHSGKVDETSREVTFCGEEEDAFYEKYGFEPEEQSIELQKRCMGIFDTIL